MGLVDDADNRRALAQARKMARRTWLTGHTREWRTYLGILLARKLAEKLAKPVVERWKKRRKPSTTPQTGSATTQTPAQEQKRGDNSRGWLIPILVFVLAATGISMIAYGLSSSTSESPATLWVKGFVALVAAVILLFALAAYMKRKPPTQAQQPPTVTATTPPAPTPAPVPGQAAAPRNKAWIWKTAVWAVILFAIAAIGYNWWKSKPAQTVQAAVAEGESTFTITAPQGVWVGKYRFPPGKTLEWRGVNPNARFQMRTESGIYSFTPEVSDNVPGIVPEASFMAIGETPEQIRIRIYPCTAESPCKVGMPKAKGVAAMAPLEPLPPRFDKILEMPKLDFDIEKVR